MTEQGRPRRPKGGSARWSDVSRFRPPRWALILGLGLVIVAGMLALRERPEPSLEAEIRKLAEAVSARPGDSMEQRRTRIERAVNHCVAPGARLRIAELPNVTSPGPALVDALVGVVQPEEEAEVELTRVDIEVTGASASAEIDVRLAGDVGRDLHAPHRQITLRLVRAASEWRIVDVDVPARKQAEPEPRP